MGTRSLAHGVRMAAGNDRSEAARRRVASVSRAVCAGGAPQQVRQELWTQQAHRAAPVYKVKRRFSEIVRDASDDAGQGRGSDDDDAGGTGPERRPPVAVVVGAGVAIGAALCRALAERGYVVFAARRRFPQDEADDNLGILPNVVRVPCDARDEASVASLFAAAEAAGEIEFVCHNIGGNVQFSALDTTERVFRKVWELCALSALHVGKAAARAMLRHGRGGTIGFTGATASRRGNPGFAAFAAAMHAKRAFAQSLSRELAPKGIHVCHLLIDAPVDTPWVRKNFVAADPALASRLVPPSGIAEAYLALHSQKPSAWAFEMDLRTQHEPS